MLYCSLPLLPTIVFLIELLLHKDVPTYQINKQSSSEEAPILSVQSVYPAVETIDVSILLDQNGEFSCIAIPSGSSTPSKDNFKDFVTVQANSTGYIEIRNLEQETNYDIYCFGMNEYERDMQTTIIETKRTVSTKAKNDAPVVVIGRIDATQTEATITTLSTLPGHLYCISTLPTMKPTRLEIKEKGNSVPIALYKYTQTTVSGLTASTSYTAYCNVESNDGIPMLSEVEDVGQAFQTEEPGESTFVFVLRILAAVFCVCMSGIFSGLNLGLMGLDLISLRMISETDIERIAGDNAQPEEIKQIEEDKKNAAKILPIRQKGNLLLCTLLIGNVMVNSIISILTADMTSGTMGFLISTCLITAFGEVIPQAYGSRHALELGAMSIGLVKVIIAILWIICKPISMILDCCLGEELGNIYNRYQLYTMFELYKDHSNFNKDTIQTMQGALVMDTKTVKEYMRPFDSVFMLPDTTILDYNTCLDIFRKGYSRIPIYHENRQDIRGILHVKELIMIDPNQCVSVDSIMQLFPSSLLRLSDKSTVSDSIKEMVNSHTEFAFVSQIIESSNSDNQVELVGIVTLEDLIKAVMRLDLVDENTLIKDRDVSSTIHTIFSKMVLNHLDPTTMDIITHFINQSLSKQNLYLPPDVIHSLIQKGSIEKVAVGSEPIYQINQTTDFAVVVLQGVFTVYIGEDRMVTEKPVFSVINISSLLEDNFMYICLIM